MDGLTELIVQIVAQHPALTVSVLGLLVTGIVFLAGFIMKRALKAAKREWHDVKIGIAKANAGVDLALTNHLPHIEKYTKDAAEEAIKTNVKLDILIGIMERK